MKAQEYRDRLDKALENDKKRLECRLQYYWETGDYHRYKKTKKELKVLEYLLKV